mgnify:CR=1 FL=1
MKNFKFSYDGESDDLFAHLEGSKSAGAIEIGDFVFDFDKDKNLVGVQILNATDVLSKLVKRIVRLKDIKGMRGEIINFRNMTAFEIEVSFKDRIERVPIIIPRIKKESPVLDH